MKKLLNTHKLILLNVIVVLATVGVLFLHPGYLFFTDYVSGPHVKPHIESGLFLFDALFRFCSFIIPAAFLQKIVFTAVIAFLLYAGNKLGRLLSDRTGVVFLTGLFFVFNPFVYERMLYGQVGVLFGFAFLIIALAESIVVVRDKLPERLRHAGFFLGLSLLFSHHYLFIASLIIVMGIAFFHKELILFLRETQWVKQLLIGIGLCLLVNLTWIGATIMPGYNLRTITQHITVEDFKVFQMSGHTSTEALGLGILMSGFWGKDQYRFVDVTQNTHIWGRGFIILVPIFLMGIFALWHMRKGKKTVTSLLLIFCAALFLALGIKGQVTAPFTHWLIDHVPFYSGMRETSKWIAIVVIVYGVLLAAGLEMVATRWKRGLVIGIYSLAGLAILLQAPLMIGGFGGQVPPTQYPADWYLADKVLNQENPRCESETLFLPWHQYMSFRWLGRVVQNPSHAFFTCPVVFGTNMEWGSIYDNSGNPVSAGITQWLSSKGTDNAAINNVLPKLRYIIIAKELDWENVDTWLKIQPNIQGLFDGPTIRVYAINRSE